MRFVFTVTPGRSGQASLTELVARCCAGVEAAFEEPQVQTILPGALGAVERRLRRRFVETHELLGRGDVLRAFAAGDSAALELHARRRHRWMLRRATGKSVFFDISKYFIRGMHYQLAALAGRPSIVFLVRDPVLNMRSFLNRGKDFRLDNNSPADRANVLRMPADMDPPSLYLWAWTEGYLRGLRLVAERGLDAPVVIRTPDLGDARVMAVHLAALGLPCARVQTRPAINTNRSQGHAATAATRADIEAFERWRDAVPPALWDELAFMRGYDPRASLEPQR
jgi:hypothetical protein